MSRVVDTAALKVFGSEFGVVDINAACVGCVEHRNTVTPASRDYLLDHLLEIGTIDIPRCHKTYGGIGVTLLKTATQRVEALGKLVPAAVLGHPVGIVMSMLSGNSL